MFGLSESFGARSMAPKGDAEPAKPNSGSVSRLSVVHRAPRPYYRTRKLGGSFRIPESRERKTGTSAGHDVLFLILEGEEQLYWYGVDAILRILSNRKTHAKGRNNSIPWFFRIYL